MPTSNPLKNVEYDKNSQTKKKEKMGVIEYSQINADAEQRHRTKLKSSTREDGYKRQQAEYMK